MTVSNKLNTNIVLNRK